MKLKIIERLGDGGFADVWKAKDELGRDVAVKIVRGSAAVTSSALSHAKALARTSHPNVVSVLTLEKVTDPSSKAKVDGIVMELIEGTTLYERFRGPKLSPAELRRIGTAVTSGMAHIHEQGMQHGDLHDANVMIGKSSIKIIDILYTDSLALLSNGTKAARLRRDRMCLRVILQHLLAHSTLTLDQAAKFDTLLPSDPTTLDLQNAFLKIAHAEGADDTTRALADAYDRLAQEEFRPGPAQAAQLVNETPPAVISRLLAKIIANRSYEQRHREYTRLLWERLTKGERPVLIAYLSAELEEQLPKGHWWPLLQMLSALQRDGWNALTRRFRTRLEQTIIKDVLSGYVDGKRDTRANNGGSIGTYARTLWPYFSKQGALASNLLTMLHKDSYTQNYIGKYFLEILPDLARTTHTSDQMMRALKGAVDNNATNIINGLEDLPEDWLAKIRPAKSP